LISRLLPRDDGAFVTGYSSDRESLLVNTNEAPVRPCPDCPLTYPSPGGVEVLDTRTGAVRATVADAVNARPTEDPSRIVAGFEDDTIGVYDVTRQEPARPGVDVGFPVEDFAVSGSDVWVWSEFGLREGRVARVDLQTGAIDHLDDPVPETYRLFASRAGPLTTLSGPGLLQQRDPASGALLNELADVYEMVAGEGLIVAQTADLRIVALDPDSLTTDERSFPFLGVGLDTMHLTNDDERMLVLGDDRQVRLYDVDARVQLGTEIPVHDSARATLVFPGWLTAAAIRPDGREAATTSDNGIIVWDLNADRWREAACELASRNLTQEEWDTYIGELAPYRATCPQFEAAG
jgi:hypothetical protein